MTTNSTEKQILKILWNQGKTNNNSLLTEKTKNLNNFQLREKAKHLGTILPNIIVESTEFEPMEIFEVDGETNAIFKEWEIFISDLTNVDADILIGLILPYINYKIIYDEAQLNDLDFYNDELDLQQTSFYEIKNDALILHISTYISRYYATNELFTPSAKIFINMKNPFEVEN